MSVRAWLMRRQIRKLFRPEKNAAASAEVLAKHFVKILTEMERLAPPTPTAATIKTEQTDTYKGDWVSAPNAFENRVFFFSHGGGYAWGNAKVYHELAYRLSLVSGARVFLLEYSLAPEAKAPVALNEGLAAYDSIVKAFPDADIVMGGDSAGGGLTLSLAHAIRDSDRKQPIALAMIAPWTDLTGSGSSIKENADKDVMLDPRAVAFSADNFRGKMAADDPCCSPHFGNQENLPPMLLQVGEDEILRDDSVRLAEKVKKSGGVVQLDVWPKMHHVWHFSARMIPEGKRAIKDIGSFFEPYWNKG